MEDISDFTRSTFISYFFGTAGPMENWFILGGLFLQKGSFNFSVVLLLIIFFSLLGLVFIMPATGGSFVQYSSIFELMSLSLACLFALFGASWYDPFGQVMSFIIVVISACEFIILLAQSTVSFGKAAYPGMSVFVFAVPFGSSVHSCLMYFYESSISVYSTVAGTAVVWGSAVLPYTVPVCGIL